MSQLKLWLRAQLRVFYLLLPNFYFIFITNNNKSIEQARLVSQPVHSEDRQDILLLTGCFPAQKALQLMLYLSRKSSVKASLRAVGEFQSNV